MSSRQGKTTHESNEVMKMQSDAPLYPRQALLFAAIILGIVSTTLLSAAEGLLPRSALPGVRSIDTIERHEMPWFDVEALKAEDAERERSWVPVAPRVGKVLDVEFTGSAGVRRVWASADLRNASHIVGVRSPYRTPPIQ